MKQKKATDKGNPLRRYIRKYKRAPAFRTPDHWPTTELRVEFTPGYVRLHHPRQGEFYITRNAWIRLLRASLPLAKHMDEQFSVPRATSRYLAEEKRFDQALRAEKRGRRRKQRQPKHYRHGGR